MKKTSTILFCIFFGLTVLVIVIHLKKLEYYVDSKTGMENIQINSENYKLSTVIYKKSDSNLCVSLSVHHIKTDIKISYLKIRLDNQDPFEIRPYSGMKPWDIIGYPDFSSIPDSIKFLSTTSNPYFAFDNMFTLNSIGTRFILRISIQMIERGRLKSISSVNFINRIEKIKIRPLDMHSDFTFLFIPIFGIISVILLIICMIGLIKKNKNNA